MERNREARRASIVGSNGFNRRKHRKNTLRHSPPDEDSGVELQESIKLRDRVKKARDLRERSGRSKRRRAERLTSNRDDETSNESENDDLDDEHEETTTITASAVAGVSFLPAAAGPNSNHVRNHHHNHNHNSSIGEQQHLWHRKNFPPISSSYSSSKVYRAPPVWMSGDEMIGVSVPRKARSASTKRLQEWASNSSNHIGGGGGGVTGGDQILRQASSSPVRHGVVSTSTPSPAPPMSPSSNASTRKKLKLNSGNSNWLKPKPPNALSKPSCSNPDELEIEIAEVLYGLLNQSQAPSSKNEDSREVNRSKSRASLSNPNSTPNSSVAPNRKKPRQVSENSSRINPKSEMGQTAKSGSAAENGHEMGGNSANSQVQPEEPGSMGLDPESKPLMVESLKDKRDLVVAKEETSSQREKESPAARTEDSNRVGSGSVSGTEIKEDPEIENVRQEKFQIDLMVPPPQVRSSPERDTGIISSGAAVVDEKPVLSVLDIELLKGKENENVGAKEKKGKSESESGKVNEKCKVRSSIELKVDSENGERDGVGGVNATGNKTLIWPNKEEEPQPLTEKTGQSTNSLPLPVSMASWPGGLPSMGFMAPLQGVVPMDGTTVTPSPLQQSLAQSRPKRCATHCYIASNINSLQQLMKMNSFWPAAAGPTMLFGSKPCALNVMPNADVQNVAVRGVLNGHDKAPAFIFPLNQHQAAVATASARPGGKSPSGPITATSCNLSSSTTTCAPLAPTTPMSFHYPNIPVNETQYLAILQNNVYPFTIPPVGASSNYRGTPAQAMPMLNSPFYPSQMIHPSQIQPPSAQSQQITSVSSYQKNLQSTENSPSQKSEPLQQTLQNQLNHHVKQPRRVESKPGSEDSRNLRNIYGHNVTMPQNFALMSSGNQSEKKPEQPHQPPNSFAMSFGSMHGSGIDIASMAQNHAFCQSLPEVARQNMQMMMAAIHKNSSLSDDDRKNLSAKSQTRSELANAPSGVIEGPARSLNMGPGPVQCSQATTENNGVGVNVTNAHIQSQLQQQQMLQLKQHQQQQQNNRNKTQATSKGGSLYTEHLNSSSTMATKFPNSVSGFTQNLVQSNNNTRNTPTSFASSTSSNPKNLPQQHNSQIHSQMHAQISFGGTHKRSKNSPGNQTTPNNEAGSPTTSSMSIGANGSPRTTNSTSTNSKTGQASALLAQQAQTSQAPKPLLNNGTKPQSRQQMAKNMQQAQLYFSNTYSQAQAHSTGSNSGPGGYFTQQHRRPDQAPGVPGTSSNGMLSLCAPVTLGNTCTNDPAKAIAAATYNLKGGGLSPSQGMIHAAQFSAFPAGFAYVHPVPSALQVKPAEQKQPAGQPEKK